MSISAPKMTIKSHFPWPIKALFAVAVIALGGASAMWMVDFGRQLTGHDPAINLQQVQALNTQVKDLTVERDRYSTIVNAAESQANIDKAMQAQLSTQITALETDNAKLKEDLAFFEGLLPTAMGNQGVAIQRLSLEQPAATQLRYRLLVMQGGKGGRDFSGNLQLAVTMVVGGKNVVVNYPEQSASPSEKASFKLDFKYYQRVDGVLTLPDGAAVKTLQAKVLEGGRVQVQESAHL